MTTTTEYPRTIASDPSTQIHPKEHFVPSLTREAEKSAEQEKNEAISRKIVRATKAYYRSGSNFLSSTPVKMVLGEKVDVIQSPKSDTTYNNSLDKTKEIGGNLFKKIFS